MVWNILKHLFHQKMPTLNQKSLWNWVGYNVILTDTRQLPEKALSAGQYLKPVSFPASSLPSQWAHESQDQRNLMSVFLVAWSCWHLSCGCNETQVARCSQAWSQPNSSETLQLSPPWALCVLLLPSAKAPGTCRKIFKKCQSEIGVLHAYAKHRLCRHILVGRSGKLFTLDLQVSINRLAVDWTDSFSYWLKSMAPYHLWAVRYQCMPCSMSFFASAVK